MGLRTRGLAAAVLVGLVAAACGEAAPISPPAPAQAPVPAPSSAPVQPPSSATPAPVAFALVTSAFTSGAPVPMRFACDGEDVSPALTWNDPPSGTQTFALIMDDPDAPVPGGWTHWVLFNMPVSLHSLPENVAKTAQLLNGGTHGNNSWSRVGYGGPCPPPGDRAHTYRFSLYAVSGSLSLAAGATKTQVLAAMQGHVLAQATLTGTYQR